MRPEIERFLRRLGYRLVLKELKHPAHVRVGGKLELSMKWQNVGSAPCYKPYRVAYRFSNANGFSKVIVSKITVNRWLPGSIEMFTPEFFKMPKDLPNGEINDVSDSIALPADLPAGQYTLSIAIVDETSTPVVRLGIKGRGGRRLVSSDKALGVLPCPSPVTKHCNNSTPGRTIHRCSATSNL